VAAHATGGLFDASEALPRDDLRALQLARLRALFEEILPRNAFYSGKLGALPPITSWDAFYALPFTTKAELAADQLSRPPFGTNLTYPVDRYARFHQTSGTTGKAPLRILDTPASWDWWARCWGYVYHAAGVGRGDRVFFAFSFGPFIGFWAAFEGARTVGALTVPGGGMSTAQRLEAMLETQATVLCSTPTYALRLIEVAAERGINLAASAIRTTIHAGEPGGSIPPVRDRIEHAFGARCFDHTGMSELGATGFTCVEQTGVHLIESEFVFEAIDPSTGTAVPAGEQGELVVTNLGRPGAPVIRYRTGDLVRIDPAPCECGRTFARLQGGILGRVDDMLVVRGVNVFPSAIEGVVREFAAVSEFRIQVHSERGMTEIRVLLDATGEIGDSLAEQVARRLSERLMLRVACAVVESGSLPRFELKARRIEYV
jgi:phenylacetate-CoA ligase